jgi:hypothetical protein
MVGILALVAMFVPEWSLRQNNGGLCNGGVVAMHGLLVVLLYGRHYFHLATDMTSIIAVLRVLTANWERHLVRLLKTWPCGSADGGKGKGKGRGVVVLHKGDWVVGSS